MDSIPRKKIDSFKRWLSHRGAEILPPTNEFELLRFNCLLGIGVVYQGKKGISVSSNMVTEAYACSTKGKKWAGKGEPSKRYRMTKKQRQLLIRDGDECFYCENKMEVGNITVEHILSKLHGGQDRLENLALACGDCNRKVGNLPIVEKIKLRDKLRANKEE